MPLPAAVLALLAVLAWSVGGTVYFKEQFLDGDAWKSRWVESEHKKDYGQWELSAGKFFGDAELDKGLQTSQDLRFYALSARFPSFSNEGKVLVLQFSVKHQQDLDCGGGYVKIFPEKMDQKSMNGESPFYIMFGPDMCGNSNKKVHVILNYKGREHLIKKDIKCKDDVLSHLYTLVLRSDQTYEVKIDNERVAEGSLEDDWDLLPPRTVPDPLASKPADWDDRPTLDDPDDTKPEDWDQPENIPDPYHRKPREWDVTIDGVWAPRSIPNPDYKGEWTPRQLDNPNYKGPWVHPEIPNPDYHPDDQMYKFDDIGALGLELWQVKSGSIFDNFFIGDDEKEAEEFARQTWGLTQAGEKKMKEEQDELDREKWAEQMVKDRQDIFNDNDDDKDGDKRDDEEKKPQTFKKTEL
ncbi:calreticulin-like [Corythoichthys intestinalis]|uniref:calreticulin-like n=1 Tax=Corythoichthys intestinalis TaxID=161448 RepID=UPI0025A5125B|nr:calreticulin-like [Corythoichthys intestinalis]XP_061790314.1 calreticulin-like [Nerophis lumbriciformis]